MYGPIPIIRDNLYVGASLEESQVPRDSVDDIVDYIVELIYDNKVDGRIVFTDMRDLAQWKGSCSIK